MNLSINSILICPALSGSILRGLCVFQHNLFNLHTFRPLIIWADFREIAYLYIALTSPDNRFMVSSEQCHKTGTRAVTACHWGKRNGYMDRYCVLDITCSQNTFSFKPSVKSRFSTVVKPFRSICQGHSADFSNFL